MHGGNHSLAPESTGIFFFLASIDITTIITYVSIAHVGDRQKLGIAGFHDHNRALHLIHNHAINQMNFNQ